MSTYLVTGGAGFIGSHLVEGLLAAGDAVRVLDNFSSGKREHVPSAATMIEGDVRDPKTVIDASQGVDGIFHLAADPSVPRSLEDPVGTFRTNVMGTLHVLDAARLAGVARVVATSSSAVYGDQPVPHAVGAVLHPLSPYGLHKLMGEQLATQFFSIYGLQTVSLRHFNVYGPRMSDTGAYASVIRVFLRQKQEGKPFTVVGDGGQTRDFVHVSDVVRAYQLSMSSSAVGHGEVLNIGTGAAQTVSRVAELLGGPLEHIPPRKADILHSVADISLTRKLLAWDPTIAFEDGLRDLA